MNKVNIDKHKNSNDHDQRANCDIDKENIDNCLALMEGTRNTCNSYDKACTLFQMCPHQGAPKCQKIVGIPI